jgi:hypothetical protein
MTSHQGVIVTEVKRPLGGLETFPPERPARGIESFGRQPADIWL